MRTHTREIHKHNHPNQILEHNFRNMVTIADAAHLNILSFLLPPQSCGARCSIFYCSNDCAWCAGTVIIKCDAHLCA